MKLTQNQTLALQAALFPKSQAALAWNTLITLTDVEELDSSITRILPAIYQNLRGAPDVQAIAKLKGSHLFTWAKNTEFASALKPLLVSLQESHINYRILKGGAINFLLGSIGSRSMGDVDILISRENLVGLQEILEKHSFKKKFADSCPHVKSGNSDQELNYINPANIEIDVHVMEDRRPSRLFNLLLHSPPSICDLMGVQITVPPPELLILHAVFHGKIAVQSSDQTQSLLDIYRLLHFSETSELLRISRKLHFNDALETYLAQLSEITNEDLNIVISKTSRISDAILYRVGEVANYLERFKDFIQIRESRAVEWRIIKEVLKSFPGNRATYAFWLATGKLRPLEQQFISWFGGFLGTSQYPLSPQPHSEYSAVHTHNQIRINPLASSTQDWRFSFSLSKKETRLSIYLHSLSFGEQSFLVFLNGQVAGVTDRNSEGNYRLEIQNPPQRSEISLRLPANGCEVCANKLSDLVLQFDTHS